MATQRTAKSWSVGDWIDLAFPFFLVLSLIAVSVFILFGPPHAADTGVARAWRYAFSLGAFILFECCIIAILPLTRQEVDTDSAFVCGLVSTAALVPTTIAEIGTVAAYVAPTDKNSAWLAGIHELALLIGAVTGLTAWGIWAIYYRRLGTVDRQNAAVYAKLCDQYSELRAAYDVEKARANASQTPETNLKLCQIERHLDAVERELGLGSSAERRIGLKWVLSTGYSNLWGRLHAVDEALFALADDDVVFERALGDVQIIQQSTIPNSPQLLRVLRLALATLRPQGAYFVDQLVTQSAVTSSKSVGIYEVADFPQTTPPPEAQASARAALHRVRHTIHEFRDATWAQLVRRRNRVLESVIYMRITSYALVGLAILLAVQRDALLAAAVYYFVGALIALFNRLRLADSADEVEDYGFSSASLVQTMPFAGLAAVGGVLLTSLLIVASNDSHSNPANLSAIFDLQGNQFGLVTAAIFGLTPGLLISRLDQATEQRKADLKSTHGS